MHIAVRNGQTDNGGPYYKYRPLCLAHGVSFLFSQHVGMVSRLIATKLLLVRNKLTNLGPKNTKIPTSAGTSILGAGGTPPIFC